MKDYKEFELIVTEEILSLLNNAKVSTEIFYKLCVEYSKILTNASPFVEENKVKGVFKYTDIENFSKVFNYYISEELDNYIRECIFEHINDIFFDILTHEETDKLPHGMLPGEGNGDFGTYYSLHQIPDDVAESIKCKYLHIQSSVD